MSIVSDPPQAERNKNDYNYTVENNYHSFHALMGRVQAKKVMF